jgi:type II secretory pathway component GspD/PulD (secretin)
MRSFQVSVGFIALSCRVFLVAFVYLMSLDVARASVHVSGSRDAVTVQAKNASLEEIIAAINSTLNLKVSVVPVVQIPITGTYSGPVRRVFARMLAGHDFVLNSSGDRLKIILATHGGNRRPASNNNMMVPRNPNIAATNGEEPVSPVQGWAGGFSVRPSSSPRP